MQHDLTILLPPPSQTARALERLVGREQYREGALDVYNIIQSPVFTRQIGFCLLESALVRLLMKALPRNVR